MRRYNLGYKLYYIATIMTFIYLFFYPMEIPFQFIPNQEIILHAKLWHNARENKMSSYGSSAERTENTGASGQRTEHTQRREHQPVTAACK